MDELELQQMRRQIDEIDQQIIRSLAQRFQLSTEVAIQKRKTASSVVQVKRASVVKEHYVTWGEASGLSNAFILNLYQMIHAESCRIQTQIIQENFL